MHAQIFIMAFNYIIAVMYTLSAMSSIPLVVNITFAPALKSFSIRSFVMSASLQG